MTPKLTYTATLQPNGDATIVLGEFGDDDKRGRERFRASNGVQIGSDVRPGWNSAASKLWIQGVNRERVEEALREH